jgi:nitroreductase
MEVFEAIKTRASVRAFGPCDIPESDLVQIVDAGRRAPSGRNRQPCEFVVVRDAAVLKQLATLQDCLGQASAAIAVIVNEAATAYWKEDAAAAIENMLLAAVALGYASLWVEGYVLQQEDKAREILRIPASRRALAILPLGKPQQAPKQAAKKKLAELTFLDHFGTPWPAAKG